MKETITLGGLLRTEFQDKIRESNGFATWIGFKQPGVEQIVVGVSPWINENEYGPYHPYMQIRLNEKYDSIFVRYTPDNKSTIEMIEVGRIFDEEKGERYYDVVFKLDPLRDETKVKVVGGKEWEDYKEKSLKRNRRLKFGETFVFDNYEYKVVKDLGKVILIVKKLDGPEKFQLSLPESINVGALSEILASNNWTNALDVAKPEYQKL